MSRNSHTILVVDPDERSYKTFESILGVKNSVMFVPNGKTAIDLPDSQNIDIIFVSHVLNGTDGIMLLESFKKRFPTIPVVILAEHPTVNEVLSSFRYGARELIIKPIDEKELVTVTNKIFRFVSNKKTKRRWFLPIKQDTDSAVTNGIGENSKGYLKNIFRKSKTTETSSVAEFNEFQMKETIPLGEDSNNPLTVDALNDTAQPNKGNYHVDFIKNSCSQIQAFLFGPLRVLVDDQLIENWPSKKGRSIFAYLIFHHKKKIFRDVLMDLFWQKSDPDSARNCLNVTIHGLRRVLQDKDPKNEYILFKDECYYFNSDIDIQLDVETFRKIWRKAQSIEHVKNLSAAVSEYERAARIYKGEFLEEEIYHTWSSLDRESLTEIYLVVLDKISKFYMSNRSLPEAILLCEKILGKDNCREDIYRRLMVCYEHSGQRDKALKIYLKCRKVLMQELEVRPTTATAELYRKIKESRL